MLKTYKSQDCILFIINLPNICLKVLKRVFVGFLNNLIETKIISNFLNLSSIQLSNALLLILIYPVITRIIGIDNFGVMMLANTFSGLAGIAINYGTNQSGIRDVATNINDTRKLSSVFYVTLAIRLLIFILYIITLIGIYWLNIKYYTYILLALPIVIAEVLNPLFFYTGNEKLKIYNISNLISKVIIIAVIIIVIKGPGDAKWVNTIIGAVTSATYLFLLGTGIVQFKLNFKIPEKQEMLKIGKENFFLTINNVSVQLQQSLMVFALAKWGNASWLGAYSLCDKVIWSTRIIIISVSNAIYPKAAHLYSEGPMIWKRYMKKMKGLMGLMFFIGSLIIFIFPGLCIQIISGEKNEIATHFLRIMAFVPTVAAFNALNVVDLLLSKNTKTIFNISIILFVIACISSFTFVKLESPFWIGTYTFLTEGSALLMYEYVIKKKSLNG